MKPWIFAIADTQGVKLAPEAADYLARTVGVDLAAIAKEIEKAALHAGGERIGVENLAAVMAAVKEQSFYELVEVISARKPEEGLRIVKEMIDQGQSPIGILSMLGRTLRQLSTARLLLRQKLNENDAAQALGTTPWIARKTLDQARAFSDLALREGLLALANVDLMLKDGRSHERVLLEQLVLELIRRR